jgi:hypothetical protein
LNKQTTENPLFVNKNDKQKLSFKAKTFLSRTAVHFAVAFDLFALISRFIAHSNG